MTETIGRKFDSGKPEMSLLPPYALEAVARVLTYGATKYERDNWKHVPDGEYRYKNAAFRHFNDFLKGDELDPETDEHHLAHAICCLMFILDSRESGVKLAGAKEKFSVPVTNYVFTTQPEITYIPSATQSVNSFDSMVVSLAGTAKPTTYMTNQLT
jgi:hypothetical protein